MKEYWDGRFGGEGMIWGETPSGTALYAKGLFEKRGVKELLVAGAGYGRNAKLFSDSGFVVDGVEISGEAVALAKKWDSKTNYILGSVFDMPLGDKKYDAVYCYDLIHLFLENDRRLLVESCGAGLREGGLMFFTCFSELEEDYGKGRRVEENTFESKPGKLVHYFTEQDLLRHFEGFRVLETGIMEDTLNYIHGEPRVYRLRYILVQKQA